MYTPNNVKKKSKCYKQTNVIEIQFGFIQTFLGGWYSTPCQPSNLPTLVYFVSSISSKLLVRSTLSSSIYVFFHYYFFFILQPHLLKYPPTPFLLNKVTAIYIPIHVRAGEVDSGMWSRVRRGVWDEQSIIRFTGFSRRPVSDVPHLKGSRSNSFWSLFSESAPSSL